MKTCSGIFVGNLGQQAGEMGVRKLTELGPAKALPGLCMFL